MTRPIQQPQVLGEDAELLAHRTRIRRLESGMEEVKEAMDNLKLELRVHSHG